MDNKRYTATWRNGEYMSGWVGDPELIEIGVAHYMSGWGTQVPDDIAQALSNGTAAEHPNSGDVIEFGSEDIERVRVLIREAKAQREAKREVQRQNNPLTRCDCGHTVPRNLVMSASLGTSCPDCYDRMSGDC